MKGGKMKSRIMLFFFSCLLTLAVCLSGCGGGGGGGSSEPPVNPSNDAHFDMTRYDDGTVFGQ
jgi:hypothetical protein